MRRRSPSLRLSRWLRSIRFTRQTVNGATVNPVDYDSGMVHASALLNGRNADRPADCAVTDVGIEPTVAPSGDLPNGHVATAALFFPHNRQLHRLLEERHHSTAVHVLRQLPGLIRARYFTGRRAATSARAATGEVLRRICAFTLACRRRFVPRHSRDDRGVRRNCSERHDIGALPANCSAAA